MPFSPYNVALLSPPGYVHALALWEVAELLAASLKSLGVPVSFTANTLEPAATNIILGYHLINTPATLAGVKYIPYQLEQFSSESPFITERALEILRNAVEVWDYSAENISTLHARGIHHVKLLPLGFHPTLERIATAPLQGIDVLHYGTLNPRRAEILRTLKKQCRVQHLEGVYGDERDAWIARSKLILSIHYYTSKIAAQVRISYLLNNRKAVVAEASDIEPFVGMIATAPYEELATTCLRVLQNETERQTVAERGYQLFKQRPMTEYLRAVLA